MMRISCATMMLTLDSGSSSAMHGHVQGMMMASSQLGIRGKLSLQAALKLTLTSCQTWFCMNESSA